MTRWSLFLQTLSLLHHFLGLYYMRTQRGSTQEEVAHCAGVHVTYLSGIERGLRNPSLKSIRAIAVAMGVSTAEIFSFESESSSKW